MNKCTQIQNQIDQILDFDKHEYEAVKDHTKTCEECNGYLLAAQQVSQDLQFMTDADDSLVDSTLASILSLQENSELDIQDNQQGTTPQNKRTYWLKPQWANALAASFMFISLIALFPYNSISNFGLAPTSLETTNEQITVGYSSAKKDHRKERPEDKFVSPYDEEFSVDLIEIEPEEIIVKQRRIPRKPSLKLQKQAPEPPKMSVHDTAEQHSNKTGNFQITHNMPTPHSQIQDLSNIDLGLNQPVSVDGSLRHKVSLLSDEQDDQEKLDKLTVTGSRIKRTDLENPSPVISVTREELRQHTGKGQNDNIAVASDKPASIEEFKTELDRVDTDGAFSDTNLIHDGKSGILSNYAKSFKHTNSRSQIPVGDDLVVLEETPKSEKPGRKAKASILKAKGNIIGNSITNAEAQNYLTQLQSLENLTFKNSSGYWANTYLPGDSQMRLIHSKLLQDKTQGQDVLDSISANIQPFDAPTHSAMDIYLSSDRAVLNNQQPTRMRLQVGLQASQRKGGHRSAMNIGLVYDSQASDKATQVKKLKALLSALLKSKQAGDKISLTVTGTNNSSNGGLLINSNQFRHGPIQVALNKLLKADESKSISLLQALQTATEHTKGTDNPSASLGSSLLILISDKNINNELSAIKTLVHNNALNGLPMSTVSLDAVNQSQLGQLALAGQGHARILQSQADAKRIIDQELLVSSRAVARALRLKIRLAKGVKLINVIDSYNLNEKQAQRVRDAEQSLDQRLSKNLGITADRGEDEEGIQIVIPSFYAGDTHVILLDVVVTNTGPVADVTLKYKDLLYLNNAVTRKQLSLNSNPKELGPLNYNVIKNILAKKFSNDIQGASQLLENGNKNQALETLIKLQRLYQSMRVQFPNWNDDAEIFNDEKLLKKYIKLLQSLSLNQSQQMAFVIDCLQYISWRKSTTTPM